MTERFVKLKHIAPDFGAKVLQKFDTRQFDNLLIECLVEFNHESHRDGHPFAPLPPSVVEHDPRFAGPPACEVCTVRLPRLACTIADPNHSSAPPPSAMTEPDPIARATTISRN
ncbi:hypothetical protein [Blastomonas sp. CACIA14H2]|uniref:hypothetical protein n=1 Tax=Blastomonas sp. CACIA14H2 TaxID=1419876 RepID=UPI004058D726